MAENAEGGTDPLFCARCARELRPGSGEFFEVRIDAVADPWPPTLDEDASAESLAERIDQLLPRLADLSEQEALDQVYRHLVIHLCTPCFQGWIENPASS